VVIKELTFENMSDWFDFFDYRAFADNEEWKGCYCTAFFYPKPEEYLNQTNKRKDFAKWLIECSRMKGYMAYENGKVVGWVNTNDKRRFPRLSDICNENENALAIVCFIVQKEFRRKGIAGKLLKRIVEDAKNKGYSYIEAYPKKKSTSEYGKWNGPYEMYIKCGFEDYKITKTNVVRKYFTEVH
jgi:GNAT superfamily N-acetyltransferase